MQIINPGDTIYYIQVKHKEKSWLTLVSSSDSKVITNELNDMKGKFSDRTYRVLKIECLEIE